MNGRKFNWLIGCLVLLATLALLTSGRLLWKKFAVTQPMDKILLEIDGVVACAHKETKGREEQILINVTLNDVDHLEQTYKAIEAGVQSVVGSKPYKIVLHDRRTAALEDFYYSIHFLIHEAIFTGGFSKMAEQINELAATNGITAKVFVDNAWVFVQLRQGDGQMYEAIPRPTNPGR